MTSTLSARLTDWLESGRFHFVDGHRIFVRESGAAAGDAPDVLLLHGFPSASEEWRHVLDEIGSEARVVTFDMLGYGLSDKPADGDYSLFHQADIAEAVADEFGIHRCLLVVHDMGQTVGAELMARQAEGTLPFELTGAVVTNGSTFIELAQLSAGQELLLSLPPVPLDAHLDLVGMSSSLSELCAPEHPPSDDDVMAIVDGIAHNDGDLLLPILIRYIEERRANADRWQGALVDFEPPLAVLWGEQDPIAVPEMARTIKQRRPATDLELWADVGHWPAIEVPKRLADGIVARLVV